MTGKWAVAGSQWGNTFQWGVGDAGGGGGPQIYDRAASSSLTITLTVTSNLHDEAPESVLEVTQEATCPQIRHRAAASSLAFTITVTSNNHMKSASSPISLTSTARAGTLELSASSALSLTQTAGSNIRNVSASSPIAATVAAIGESTRNPLTNVLTLTQTAVLIGVPKRKSATSTITFAQQGIGVGPIKRTVVDTLSLTQSVRSGVFQLESSDFLVLSHASRVAETYILSASSTQAVTQTASGVNTHVFATSSLALTDEADTAQKQRSVTNAITLVDTATVEKIKTVTSSLALTHEAVQGIVALQINQPLSLTDLARLVSIKIVASPSVVELTDSAESSIRMLQAESTLVLEQSLNVIRPWRVSAENELTTIEQMFDLDSLSQIDVIVGLQDSASVLRDGPRALGNVISFATQATQYVVVAGAIAADADNTLSLNQEGRLSKQHKNETQTIPLSQSATGVVGRELTNQLDALDVEATVMVVRANITGSNTLEIKQSVAFIFEKSDVLCTYTPFVGDSSNPDAPIPPPSSYTSPVATPGFRLQFPGSGAVTEELVLRAPNLGNLDRLAMTRINRETRGGTLIVFADPAWPKVQTLLLSFSGLSFDESQNLLTFMENHIGEEIRLIDWEDRLWRGVIVNPQDPVVQDGRGCRYTASFEFEGEKV